MSILIKIDDYGNVKVEKFGGRSIWTGFVRCAKYKKTFCMTSLTLSTSTLPASTAQRRR